MIDNPTTIKIEESSIPSYFLANLIKVINWDYLVNMNNKEMLLSTKAESEIIYECAFSYDVKCHRDIINAGSKILTAMRHKYIYHEIN